MNGTETVSPLQGLYLITDHDQLTDQQLADDVSQALNAGAHLLQYRDKTDDWQKRLRQAGALRELTLANDCLLIINDDVALAEAVAADGVHLGKDDGAVAAARQKLGPDRIIGASCYNQLELARQAANDGADYLAFGRFFPSSTKPAAVQAAPELLPRASSLGRPLVAIGGITPDNAAGLVAAGADMLAVINAVFSSPDIGASVRQFISIFEAQNNP